MNNNLNRNLKTVFLPKAIAKAGLRTYQMTPFTMGLLDVETQRLIDAADFSTDGRYQLVYKGSSKGQDNAMFGDKTGAGLTIRSLEFTQLDKIHAPEKLNYVAKPMIAYLGYDGISTCKTLSFPCGETFGLLVRVVGQTVRNVFGKDLEELIPFTTGCCDDCSLEEKGVRTIETMRKAFEESSFYVKNYIKMEQVKSCCPDEDPFDRIRYSKFCITVCDMGDSKALADVQLQYEGYDIEVIERKDTYTTYEVCLRCEFATADQTAIDAAQVTYDAALAANPQVQADIDAALVVLNAAIATAETNADTACLPASLTVRDTVLSNCDECPTGFTKVDAGVKLLVQMVFDGVEQDALVAVQTVIPTAVKASLIGVTAGEGTFEVVVPEAFDLTQVIADVQFSKIGEVATSCVQTAPVTIDWVKCGEGYKITRTMCLIKKNNDCDVSELAEIVAEYENSDSVVGDSIAVSSTNDCNTTYTLTQENNACLEDGCDTFGKDGAKFDDIPSYEGFIWEMCACEGWTVDATTGCPVAPVIVDADCKVGLKFTGALVNEEFIPCAFSIHDAIEREPLRFEVSIVDMATRGDMCDQLEVDWTVVQRGKVAEGRGDLVAREEVLSRNYDGQYYIDPKSENGILMQRKLGIEYGANPSKSYTHVDAYLTYSRLGQSAYSSATHNTNRELVKVFIEADKTTLVEEVKTFFNQILAAKGGRKLL